MAVFLGDENFPRRGRGRSLKRFVDAVTNVARVLGDLKLNHVYIPTYKGTNFIAGLLVQAQNADGDVVYPTAISLTNSTTVVATFDIDVDGTYFIRVENTDGFAGISSSALLTVS